MILRKSSAFKFIKNVVAFVLGFYFIILMSFLYMVMTSEATLRDVLGTNHSRDHVKEISKEIIVDTSSFDEFGGITRLTKNIIEQIAQDKKQWRFSLLLSRKNQTFLELTRLPNVRIIKVSNLFGKAQNIVFNLFNIPRDLRHSTLLLVQNMVFNLFNIPTFGLARDTLMQIICYGNIFLDKHTDLFWDPVGGRFINDFSIPKITTIHDTIEIDMPELFNDRTVCWVKERNIQGLKNSCKITTVSEFTKRRVINIYGIDSKKIRTIPIRVARKEKHDSDIGKARKILDKYKQQATTNNCNYIIFVSQYYPNKNHKRLIQAFANLMKNNKKGNELMLVIVGNMSLSNGTIEKFANQFDCKNNIVFTGKVNDEELSILLKNALCFVHPSLYEGFGMPLVESMSSGVPIACSNVSSIPEVVGDAAVFFDPYDISDIERAMSDLIKSPTLRNSLIKKGYTQAKKFEGPRAMIEEYIKTFEEAMNCKD